MSLDRFTGALLGLALGDALGAPYEFRRPPFEVTREFGTGHFGTAPGHPTDDSTLAAHCAEALLEPGDFAANYVRRLVAWAVSDPPDIGNQTHRAALSWAYGSPPDADERAQGNGSLMAVAPIGLRFANDAGAARDHAEAFARLTHPSPAAAECNAVFVELLSAALDDREPPLLSALPEEVDPAGPKMGWCRLTLHLAVHTLEDAKRDGPFEALLRLVALGGDTDTNAAVAGALLGAAHRTAAWPADLLGQLALRKQMERLAEGLWRAAAGPVV